MKNIKCLFQDQEYCAMGSFLNKIDTIPEEFGVIPDWGRGTDSFSAIDAELKVEDDSIIVYDLWLCAEDDRYLPIHGVQPTFPSSRSGFGLYSGLDIKLEGDGSFFLVCKPARSRLDITGFSCPYDYEEVHELVIENGKVVRKVDRSAEAAADRLKDGPTPLQAAIAVDKTPKAYWRRLRDWISASLDPVIQRDCHLLRRLCSRKSCRPLTCEDALTVLRLKDRAEAAGFSAQKSRTRQKAVETRAKGISSMPDNKCDTNMQNDSQDSWHPFDFSTLKDIEKREFVGPVKIADWPLEPDKIADWLKEGKPYPDYAPGIYLIVWNKSSKPNFKEPGTGGHFKKKDPNVPINTLNKKWIDKTCVLYIGMAGWRNGLKRRLNCYMQFGAGSPVSHWGGRYIWQIRESGELLVYWKELPHSDPRAMEKGLLMEFRKQYDGRLPFANIKG
jgi:hypothetical protein